MIGKQLRARKCVEVETEDEVGRCHQQFRLLRVFVMALDFVGIRNPVKEIGIFVRHNNTDRLTLALEIVSPCESRTNGIAVGVDMSDNHNVSSGGDDRAELRELRFR